MRIVLADYPQAGARPPRLAALEALGHEVCYFDHTSDRLLRGRLGGRVKAALRRFIRNPRSLPGMGAAQAAAVNRGFLTAVRSFAPDLVFIGKGSLLSVDTLHAVREKVGCPMICHYGEPLALELHADRARQVAPLYDVFFLLDEMEILNRVPLAGGVLGVSPHAADPQIFRPLTLSMEEEALYGCDVAFVGVVRPNRLPVLRALAQMPIRFKIWGIAGMPEEDWKEHEPDVARCLMGSFHPQDLARIHAAARIALNLHGLYPMGNAYEGLPMRVFEQTASGAFLLCDDGVQIRRCFAVGEEVDVYDSIDALREKVRFYLGHESLRRAVAARGRERTLRDHTYEVRLREMISLTRRHVSLPA